MGSRPSSTFFFKFLLLNPFKLRQKTTKSKLTTGGGRWQAEPAEWPGRTVAGGRRYRRRQGRHCHRRRRQRRRRRIHRRVAAGGVEWRGLRRARTGGGHRRGGRRPRGGAAVVVLRVPPEWPRVAVRLAAAVRLALVRFLVPVRQHVAIAVGVGNGGEKKVGKAKNPISWRCVCAYVRYLGAVEDFITCWLTDLDHLVRTADRGLFGDKHGNSRKWYFEKN